LRRALVVSTRRRGASRTGAELPFHLIDEGEDADALPRAVALRDSRQVDDARTLELVECLTHGFAAAAEPICRQFDSQDRFGPTDAG
jgi:hypothetical protein